MSVETLSPPQGKIEALFGRPLESVKAPALDQRISRQEIMQMTVLAKEPERYIERPIDSDKPWSAFGQVMFIREHIVDGKVIKKIAAVSIAYPGGVGTRMAGEILGKTLGVEQSEFELWKGVKEGGIIAASKEVPDVMGQFSLMDSFIENSGSVIENRHAQVEHEVVQHFFELQKTRKDFLATVKKHAAAILDNPEFTGRSAIDPEYMNTGIYLIEGIVENGIWEGGDPNGKRTGLVGIAADQSHKDWLQWAEKKISEMKGDGIIVDAEDTETVHACGGGKKGCSEFFAQMEGGVLNNIIYISEYSVISGIAGSIAASEKQQVGISGGGVASGSYERDTCSTCGEYKDKENGCKCSA